MVLRAERVTKYFGEFKAIDDVTLAIDGGTVTSIVGPNGAGKTTLLNILSGVLKPDKGRVIYDGRDITGLPPHKVARLGIARCSQLANVFSNLTVLDNVRVAVASAAGAINNLLANIDDRHIASRAEEVLDLFGLLAKRDVKAADLSYGEKKLLDVAMSVALKPKLILLDEPTSGVSTREKKEVIGRIIKVLREEGLTAVVVEHDVDVVLSHSDRVVLMHEGRVVEDGEPEKVVQSEVAKRVLLGVM